MAQNPWLPEHWNITAQGQYIKKYGPNVAKRTAMLAGSHIGATKPTTDKVKIERHWILTRKISEVTNNSGGGGGGNTNVIGAGSSGEGPPD